MDIKERAELFGRYWHRNQKYGDLSYTSHLEDVAALVDLASNRYALSDEDYDVAYAAAWLHDIVEDTEVEPYTIHNEFGHRIYDIMMAVTDPFTPNWTREQKKDHVYKKMQKAERLATMVKLCDRAANVEFGNMTKNEKKLDMYRKEHPEFKSALYIPGEYDWLWERIERYLNASK